MADPVESHRSQFIMCSPKAFLVPLVSAFYIV